MKLAESIIDFLSPTESRRGDRPVGEKSPDLARVSMFVVIVMSFAIVMTTANGATRARAASDTRVGSVNDYMSSDPGFADAYTVPLLGIEVKDGAGTLDHRYPFRGVEIVTVSPRSAAASAGLHGRNMRAQAALTVGLLAVSMFFPPAMIGVAALDSSESGEFRELIIAVDGRRTRNITDLDDALTQAQAGEIVYLTVVSDGERRQVRVKLRYPLH